MSDIVDILHNTELKVLGQVFASPLRTIILSPAPP